MSFENPEISIIVPAYNSELYLPGCLDSIIAQTFADWELIIADDGSTDKTGEIADKYASSDKRIRVLHMENRGVSASRNSCLDIACGKYFLFADADDYLKPGYLSDLIALAKSNDADIVQCSFCLTDDNGNEISGPNGKNVVYEGQDEILNAYFTGPVGEIRISVWAKLFLRERFAGVRFDTGLRIYEDSLFVYECCRKADKICSSDVPVYFYRQHEGSVMHARLDKLYPDYFSVFKRQSEDYQDNPKLLKKIMRRKTETALWLMSNVDHGTKNSRLWELRKIALGKSGCVLFSSAPLSLKAKITGLALMPHVYFGLIKKRVSRK